MSTTRYKNNAILKLAEAMKAISAIKEPQAQQAFEDIRRTIEAAIAKLATDFTSKK